MDPGTAESAAQMQNLANAYAVYTDPVSNMPWVSLPNGRCSFDPDAVEIAHAISDATPAKIILHGYSLGAPCIVDCHRNKSMPDGFPWETPTAIGLHIDNANFFPMTETMAQRLEQRLFFNHWATTMAPGFVAAMKGARNMEWAWMDTTKGKFQGIVARCTACDATCRIAWCKRAPSSAHHMSVQRQLMCHFL
jgi:hypothetical protein